jgi:hypothetical protein
MASLALLQEACTIQAMLKSPPPTTKKKQERPVVELLPCPYHTASFFKEDAPTNAARDRNHSSCAQPSSSDNSSSSTQTKARNSSSSLSSSKQQKQAIRVSSSSETIPGKAVGVKVICSSRKRKPHEDKMKHEPAEVERLPCPDQTASFLKDEDDRTNVATRDRNQSSCLKHSSPGDSRTTCSTQTETSHSSSTTTSHFQQQQQQQCQISLSSIETIPGGVAVGKSVSTSRKRKSQQEISELLSERDRQRKPSTVSTRRTSHKEEKVQPRRTAAALQQDPRRQKQEQPRDEQTTIKAIVSTRLWSDNTAHVATALASLCKIVAPEKWNSNDKNRRTAFRLGAPLAIAQVMRFYIHIPEIQRDGCFALSGLSLCRYDADDAFSAGQTILDTGGLECCLQALQRHAEWATVQAAGCCLIHNLCSSSNPTSANVRKAVFIEGGLLAVLRAMDHHQQHGRVQNIACRAMHSLLLLSLQKDEEDGPASLPWIRAFVDSRGIEIVLAAMSNHVHDAEIQVLGCKFLTALLSTKDIIYFTRVVQSQGLVTIVQVQRLHQANDRVVRAAQNVIGAMKVPIFYWR